MKDQRPTISMGPLIAVIALLTVLGCGGALLLGIGFFAYRAASIPVPAAPTPVAPAPPTAPPTVTPPALKATLEEPPSVAPPAESTTAEPQP
jgi:hypothetical protein